MTGRQSSIGSKQREMRQLGKPEDSTGSERKERKRGREGRRLVKQTDGTVMASEGV